MKGYKGENVGCSPGQGVQGDLSEEVKTHYELAKESWSYRGRKVSQADGKIYAKTQREGTFKDMCWRGQWGPNHEELCTHTSGT